MDGIIAFVAAFLLLGAAALAAAFVALNAVGRIAAWVRDCDPHAPSPRVEEVE